MPIQRLFLDWSRPGLVSAAEYLLGRDDLANLIVALPGGRAGRRLLEILVELSGEKGSPLVPPQITTVAHIPEMLYTPQRPFADDTTQTLAWAEVLRTFPRDRLALFVSQPPADDDASRWYELGEMLRRQHRELAADALNFADVVETTAALGENEEARRWQVLSDLQQAYLALLDSLKLWDLQTARRMAHQLNEYQTDRDIVLIGMVDLDRTMRQMFDQVADRVTSVILAPEKHVDRFDAYGCVRPEAWHRVPLDLADENVIVVGDADDQAEAVVQCLAALDGKFAADEIAIGVPDEGLVPLVQQRLTQCGVASRYGVGRPLSESGPYRLLEAVASYLEGRRADDFSALVRHPDLETFLADACTVEEQPPVPGAWLVELDTLLAERLPYRLDHAESRLGGSEQLAAVFSSVEGLLVVFDGKSRTIGDWAEPIATLLSTVYCRPLDRDDPQDAMSLAACRATGDQLAALAEIVARLQPQLGAAEAIRMVLRAVETGRVAPPADQPTVEMLGWLELPLDDAPALVVTSVNEGLIPQSVNNDLFLPNGLRHRLGLVDNDRRYARDAYALAVLLASRPDVRLIVGRRTSKGDPMSPSRLLLTADRQKTAGRTLMWFADSTALSSPTIASGRMTATREHSDFPIPPTEPPSKQAESMRVTEFRDYLACPYRYYLRHILRLESSGGAADELSPAQFGSLLHEVLCRFGTDRLASSTDAEAINAMLDGELATLVRSSYGKSPLPSVSVQTEQARRRLRAFAEWQAAWTSDGWEIVHTEVDVPSGKVWLEVDADPMGLRGRIDRIDVNRTGGYVVFDYKTSETAKSPQQSHFSRRDGWIDLQLPLYRHLVRALDIDIPVQLGYIPLAKNLDVQPDIASWSEAELAEADEAAREVIRGIRRGDFVPTTDPPSAEYDDYAAICQTGQFRDEPRKRGAP